MKHFIQSTPFVFLVLIFACAACTPAAPTFDATQMEDQVATVVAQTLAAMPTNSPTLTSTPLPPPTVTLPPTEAIPSATAMTIDTAVATPKPEYACDILRQEPHDDTEIRRDNPFDIEWTLVNTGTQKWAEGTYLQYQTGSEMTSEKKIALPTLKPGETYNVVLGATAPSERGLHIMVWEVISPGKAKESAHWMCYPYVRIVVKK